MSIKVERLVNLTIALLEARRPLSLEELRERTGYYDQDGESGRRMFERDKDELRRLGVPLELRVDPLTGESAYVVDRREYELPDVQLDRDEVAALAVALRLTGQSDDRVALSKLAARSPDALSVPGDIGARMDLSTDALDDVADALVERRTITFDYRTAAGQSSSRRVDPYGVALRRGSWYLVGHDHDRDAQRSFRLDRVVGRIRTVGDEGAFTVPDDVDLAGHVTGPATEEEDVDLEVAPTARWAVESQGGRHISTGTRDGWTRHRLDAVDPGRLTPWLLGLGPDVEVVSPAWRRDRIIARLDEMLAAGESS